MTRVELRKLHCHRCGYKWVPRVEKIRVCPKCKSPWWDKPKDTPRSREGAALVPSYSPEKAAEPFS
jgi:hypothetical protein